VIDHGAAEDDRPNDHGGGAAVGARGCRRSGERKTGRQTERERMSFFIRGAPLLVLQLHFMRDVQSQLLTATGMWLKAFPASRRKTVASRSW
jgi:hypothetical protein